jgi:hypothetical protein
MRNRKGAGGARREHTSSDHDVGPIEGHAIISIFGKHVVREFVKISFKLRKIGNNRIYGRCKDEKGRGRRKKEGGRRKEEGGNHEKKKKGERKEGRGNGIAKEEPYIVPK